GVLKIHSIVSDRALSYQGPVSLELLYPILDLTSKLAHHISWRHQWIGLPLLRERCRTRPICDANLLAIHARFDTQEYRPSLRFPSMFSHCVVWVWSLVRLLPIDMAPM